MHVNCICSIVRLHTYALCTRPLRIIKLHMYGNDISFDICMHITKQTQLSPILKYDRRDLWVYTCIYIYIYRERERERERQRDNIYIYIYIYIYTITVATPDRGRLGPAGPREPPRRRRGPRARAPRLRGDYANVCPYELY